MLSPVSLVARSLQRIMSSEITERRKRMPPKPALTCRQQLVALLLFLQVRALLKTSAAAFTMLAVCSMLPSSDFSHVHRSVSSCCAAGKQDLEAPAAPAETGPKTYKAPAFDAPDSENPKKATPILETEAEFVRYRRQRTVRL